MMNFQIMLSCRCASERCERFAHLALSIGPQQHLRNDIFVPIKYLD
jgi:hypothetical protein